MYRINVCRGTKYVILTIFIYLLLSILTHIIHILPTNKYSSEKLQSIRVYVWESKKFISIFIEFIFKIFRITIISIKLHTFKMISAGKDIKVLKLWMLPSSYANAATLIVRTEVFSFSIIIVAAVSSSFVYGRTISLFQK